MPAVTPVGHARVRAAGTARRRGVLDHALPRRRRCRTARCSSSPGPRATATGCSTRSPGLLVRLHLAGFYWGDCSLSNTLFRRDAGELQAYLVDAETSELHETLADGARAAGPR